MTQRSFFDGRQGAPASSRGRSVAVDAALLLVSALIAACGGGGGQDANPSVGASLVAVAPTSVALVAPGRGTLLGTDWSTYPRLVRLAHQLESGRNGRVVASVSERGPAGWQPTFYASADDGASFAPSATIADPDFATGVCCGTLFELPRAVGVLAEGTLLYATSVGYDAPDAFVENRVYASLDAGRSFVRWAGVDCGRSAVPRVPGRPGSGVWEPEFFIAADGSLACVFSDETEAGKSQVLKLTRTLDGVSWSAPRIVVAGTDANDRPGMAGVRRLPDGRFLMVFEGCSLSRLDCAARLKLSPDGLDWGDPGDFGQRPQTAEGAYFRHTPTLAWTPLAGHASGVLVLTGQLVASDAGGTDTVDTGRVLMVTDGADGAGAWRLVAAPIGLPTAPSESNECQNYSSPLLPSVDGTSVLTLQTDRTADGGCVTRFGRGVL